MKVGRVTDGASVPLWLDKLGGRQYIQMEGKRRSRQFEAASDFASRKTLRSILDEQTEDFEASFLRQSGEGIDSRSHIHISRTVEI